jgi:hypothetical protein
MIASRGASLLCMHTELGNGARKDKRKRPYRMQHAFRGDGQVRQGAEAPEALAQHRPPRGRPVARQQLPPERFRIAHDGVRPAASAAKLICWRAQSNASGTASQLRGRRSPPALRPDLSAGGATPLNRHRIAAAARGCRTVRSSRCAVQRLDAGASHLAAEKRCTSICGAMQMSSIAVLTQVLAVPEGCSCLRQNTT